MHCEELKVFLLNGQSNDGHLRVLCSDKPRRCNSVHSSHVDIHYDDCRSKLIHTRYCLLTITRFASYFDVGMGGQCATQSLSDGRMVVYE